MAVASTLGIRLLGAVLLMNVGIVENDEPAYSEAITRAQKALDEGRFAEAAKSLESTAPVDRGFEFDYLKARLDQAADRTGPAPRLLQFAPNPPVETRYAVLGPSGRRLVFICRDGGVRVQDLADLAAPARLAKHPKGEAVWSGAFSGDGRRFLTGHQNGDVLVWDVETWTIARVLPIPGGKPVGELAVAADGQSFAAEGEKTLELWALAGDAPRKVADIGPRYNFGEGLAFSPKGDLVATGGMFDILLHDAKTGKPLREIGHASYTMGLLFSPDGTRIASAPRGNVNKFLAVFDVGSSKLIFNQGPLASYVVGMAFSPNGRRVAVTGCDNQVRIHDATTGATVLAIPRPACGSKPAFSGDGQLLGWSEPDGFHFIDLGRAAAARPEPPAAKPSPR